jgi:Transposase DDE domain group 1
VPCLYGILSLLTAHELEQEGTFHVHATRPRVDVSADGAGVVSHAGSRLIADLADQTTLTAQLSAVFAHRTVPQTAHDPGRVLTDLAVMLADGGECISDIAALADQAAVFGPVASDSTCWRVLNSISEADLDGIAAARAAARAGRGDRAGAARLAGRRDAAARRAGPTGAGDRR